MLLWVKLTLRNSFSFIDFKDVFVYGSIWKNALWQDKISGEEENMFSYNKKDLRGSYRTDNTKFLTRKKIE